jgi:hypothetical protein
MKSYTALRNLYGVITNNTNTTNLTNGDQWINDAHRIMISYSNGDYTEGLATDTTVASQQNYELPYNYEKLNSVTITVGTYKYPIVEVTDRKFWDVLQQTTGFTSTIPQYYYIDAAKIYFYPTPSANGNTINYSYKIAVRDLANADYTTGTVTLTNASTAVTGAGTTFTAAMVGRYLKGNTDGYWYKIAGFTNATSITLAKAFQGTTGAGLAFTIGEMPIIPEAFHQNLVDYAAHQYFLINEDLQRSREFERKWNEYVANANRIGVDPVVF